ncbi:hypothetical protein ABEW34_21675 [Paenibacillus algorifonticola]|uniref:hypothetical protein n=1 Tax=Paenibacillus algorifonticola TaxID=684063 RepID=UPI003D2E30E5
MRAIVYFTDGTSAEQLIECSTTVTKPGAATPTATPAPSTSEPTPTPRPIIEVSAQWDPSSIFTGDKASLSAIGRGYTEAHWELSNNLKPFIQNDDFNQPNITFDIAGVYTAKLVASNEYETVSDTAILYVNDPKPVAIISGVTRWIQGRPFPNLHHLNNSYSPLASRGVTIDFSKSEIRYKKNDIGPYTVGAWPSKAPDELGSYTLEGKVYDSQGRVSEWATYPLEIVPDQPPVVSVIAPETGVRNIGLMLQIDASSPDGDKLERLLMEERYDADNDGDFDEENWKVIYDGPFTTTHSANYTTVGKRQYRATVTEDYGLSGKSNIAETDIINRAPIVDFTANGLTQQPDQGADSGPPVTTYSPDSILRSWVNKTLYEGGTTNKASWKVNGSSLTTRNAVWADFNGNYNLAKNLKPLPAWEGSLGQVYAGYKMTVMTQAGYYYTYSYRPSESKDWAFAIRDVWTGQIEQSYVHPGITFKGSFYKYHPSQMKQAYFLEAGTLNVSGDTLRLYNIETGQLIEEYPTIAPPATGGTSSSYWDDPTNTVIGTAFSPDRQFLYVAYRESNGGRTFDIRQKLFVAKYSVAQKTLYWTKLVHPGIDQWNVYQIGGIDVDAAGNVLLAANTRRGTEDDWTALFYVVDPNGNQIASHGIPLGMLSEITMSADRSKGYVTSMWFQSGRYGYSQVSGVLSYNTATNGIARPEKSSGTIDDVKFPSKLGKTAVNKAGIMATPFGFLILPDGSITSEDQRNPYNKLGAFSTAEAKSPTPSDPITTQILWPKLGIIGPFSQPSDEFWVLGAGVKRFDKVTYQTVNGQSTWSSSAFQKIQQWSGILANNQTPMLGTESYDNKAYFVTDTMKYTDGNGYDGVTFTGSSSVLPNGAVIGTGTQVTYTGPISGSFTSKQVVIPFKGESTGELPRLLDDITVEIDSDAWGGLLYDPNSIMRNQVIEFDIAINHLSNDRPIGAAIQIQDEKNMYTVEWTNSTLTLYKVVAGQKSVLSQVTMTRSVGYPYAFKLESLAGVLRVSINGAKKIEVNDSTYKKGSAGILSLGQQQAAFSNIKRTNYGDSVPEETIAAVLVGETILYKKLFKDPESDPKWSETWHYAHDPNYFANPLGRSIYDEQTFSTVLESLDKPGKYEITHQAGDDPGFVSYRLSSEPITKTLYVHRRPVAVPDVRFTGTVYPGGAALDYLTYDKSYDPDIPERLDTRIFRTRWADENTWTAGERLLYNRPGVELIIQEQVKDLYGAWSFWAEVRVYLDELPPVNQNPPTMTIVVPDGTLDKPTVYISEPTVRWVYADQENDPQEQYRLNMVYADDNTTVLNTTLYGDDLTYEIPEGMIEKGRTVRVQGRVYSKGTWSELSNKVYFVLNTPPQTTLLNYNGVKASEPVYTNSNKPNLQVAVTDRQGDVIRHVDYEVFYNPTGTLVVDTNTATGSSNYTTPALQEGLHNWRARAHDGLEWGPYSGNGYFFVDTVKPRDVDEQLIIEPTAVTVNFNAFSDETPSSGHALRTFYMQKVNSDGSVTNIDLNKDGTAEYSIPLPLTTRSYKVASLVPGQEYRLTVIDNDVAGNQGHYAYIYFVTNRPPTGDFDWSPKPVYEGDTVTIISSIDDPDKDELAVTYKVKDPKGATKMYSYTFNNPYPVTGPTFKASIVGDWEVELTVSDGLADPVKVTKTIKVLPLGITAEVLHTDEWERNRLTWNKEKPKEFRDVTTFWAGERFVLQAATTDTGASLTKAARVDVEAIKIGQTTLSSSDKITWSGYLGNENADLKLETLKDGAYTFVFTATYSNGVVKETDVTIKINGKWTEYFRFHKNW